jgi:hypothetical protein
MTERATYFERDGKWGWSYSAPCADWCRRVFSSKPKHATREEAVKDFQSWIVDRRAT